jgi:hypothetical protein
MSGGVSIIIFAIFECHIIEIIRKMTIHCCVVCGGVPIFIFTILERPLYGVIPWDAIKSKSSGR